MFGRSQAPVRGAAAALAGALVIGGCAHNAPPVAPPEALRPRSVAIIPVLPSEYLTLDRRSLLVGGIERLDRYAKQKDFVAQYDPDRAVVAEALTMSLLAAARHRGFDAIVLGEIVRNPDDPEDFEYPRIASDADVIVHVHLRDMGVFTPLTSLDYEPNVDTQVRLIARKAGFEILNEDFHYGANATRSAFWAVPSDPSDRWPNFDSVMAQRMSVEASWKKGAEALGVRIIEQLPAPVAR